MFNNTPRVSALTNTETYNRERRELRVFKMLLRMTPHLEDRLMESSEEELMSIANMVG
jgi:hypothetical protein